MNGFHGPFPILHTPLTLILRYPLPLWEVSWPYPIWSSYLENIEDSPLEKLDLPFPLFEEDFDPFVSPLLILLSFFSSFKAIWYESYTIRLQCILISSWIENLRPFTYLIVLYSFVSLCSTLMDNLYNSLV